MGFLSGLGSILGDTIGSIVTGKIADKNAKKQFSRELAASNTAHQREVADLEAAGLNPILSASGSGASVPNASVSPAPDFSNVGSSAMSNYQRSIDAEATKQNILHTQASTAKTAADADIARTQAQLWRKNPEMMAGSSVARDVVASVSTAKRAGKALNENVIKFGKKWGSPVPDTGSWKSKFLNFLYK